MGLGAKLNFRNRNCSAIGMFRWQFGKLIVRLGAGRTSNRESECLAGRD